MTRSCFAIVALLTLGLGLPANAQIDPYRPIAHATIGIYQDAGASWGWERVGSWGWERVGSWGWERVGSWGWERVERTGTDAALVGLVFVEGGAFGGATQHWAFFDNYDAAAPTELRSSLNDYPDLPSYLGDMAVLARSYVPVPAGNGVCPTEPTCVTLTRGASDVADAHIRQSEPDRNFGASQSLTVSGGASGARRALLRFDTSAIPVGATVESAELSLTGLLYSGSAVVTVVMAPWDEASVTWSSFERAGAAFGVASGGPHLWRAAATVPFTSAGATTTTSLGALVQAWVDSAIPNYGVILDKTAGDELLVLASSESPDRGRRPQLTVCYRACEARCSETCGEGTICAAGRCREVDEPWAGALDACFADAVEGDPCRGHGIFANGRCFCEPGYYGDACEQADGGCPNGCSGHGACAYGRCFCEPGYLGDACEQADGGCPNGCSGHGACADGRCFCDPGFAGDDCASGAQP